MPASTPVGDWHPFRLSRVCRYEACECYSGGVVRDHGFRLRTRRGSAKQLGHMRHSVYKLIPISVFNNVCMTTSPIAEALAATAKPAPKRCLVGRWLDTLDTSDRDALTDACKPGRVNTVWEALRAQGVDVTASQISWYRHWKGGCSCNEVQA